LEPWELKSFFLGFLRGEVPDYQMAAFLMAVHFRGLDPSELESLLDLMIASGEVLDLSHIPAPKVDKHSTGGVGDKTSLVLAPLAAELGLCVPMMSGRGLGHTAGTLDKLEAIPGFRTQLTLAEFRSILEEVGVAMIGQTEEIAPLDRRLYALRDATSTVPSLPLISASIMSKKLAEGLQGLVLDVKTGEGAFIPKLDSSRALARTMVALGEARGVATSALVTSMDAPLGRAVGNGLETREALDCLAGRGPEDLNELTAALTGEMLFRGGLAPSPETGSARARLTGEMLFRGGLAPSPETGSARAREALEWGLGLERMRRLVELQGGDPRVLDDPARIPRAPIVQVLEAPREGFVAKISPVTLGYGVVELGGGRRRMDDSVDLTVGFVLHAGPGDRLERGEPVGEVHAADETGLQIGLNILATAVEIADEAPAPRDPLIIERVVARG
jgi:thymidine phosphorylase